MLISPGLLERSAEPVRKDGPNRRNREPSIRVLPLLSFFSFLPRPQEARTEEGRFLFVRLFSRRPTIDRSIPRGDRPSTFSLASPPPLIHARTEGSPLVQISILRRQLFATLLFFHSVTHMEMEIGHRNPVCQFGKHPRQGEKKRERGRERSTAFPFLLLRKRGG